MLMIRRLIRRFVREEDGIALVLALAAIMVLAITTTGVIVAGTTNESTAFVSLKERSAFAAAQEALAYGKGVVYGSACASTSCSRTWTDPNSATVTYTACYWTGSACSSSPQTTWHVVGTGIVSSLTRTVSVNIGSSSTTTTQSPLWNYLYEDNTSPSCLGGSITISMSILTRGDFCIGGSVRISGASTRVEIGGVFTASSAAATVGSASGGNVAALEIAGTPSSTACNIHGTIQAPGTGTCASGQGWVYANTVGTTLSTTPVKPSVNFASAYATQAAGSQSGCTVGGKNLLDDDSTMNLSNTTNINSVLLGSTAYDCVVTSALGTNEIKWTPPSTLYVSGELFLDGTINIPNNTVVYYSGLGSLYLTGGFTMGGNNTKFCGITNCTASWNTANNVVVLVADCWANSTGSTLIIGMSPACVDVGNASAQFAAWVNTTYSVQAGVNMGPVICDTFNLGGNAGAIQPILGFPVGTPGSTTSSTTFSSPTGWSG